MRRSIHDSVGRNSSRCSSRDKDVNTGIVLESAMVKGGKLGAGRRVRLVAHTVGS